jgi:hypothetical protein
MSSVFRILNGVMLVNNQQEIVWIEAGMSMNHVSISGGTEKNHAKSYQVSWSAWFIYEPGTSWIVTRTAVTLLPASYARPNAVYEVVLRLGLGMIIVTSIYHTVKNVMTEIDLLHSN